MHRLDPAQIGARELGEHLDAQIGDEPVAEIVHRDVGDIFGDRLDDGHDHDGAGDPVDHLLVLADEHVVGGPLDEEGDGAGGCRGQQHGEEAISRSPMRGLRCSFQMRRTISPVVYSTWSSSALRVMALESLNN